MINSKLRNRLLEFIENEARSCSMDPGCITPEYVYRMWGGSVSLEEIEKYVRKMTTEGTLVFEGGRKFRRYSLL